MQINGWGMSGNYNMINQNCNGMEKGRVVSGKQEVDNGKKNLKDYCDNQLKKRQLDPENMIYSSTYNALGMLTDEKGKTSGQNSQFKDQEKAMRIAQSMMKGNKVPSKDEKFLMNYSMELYLSAKQVQNKKTRHKKVKSVIDEEQKKNKIDDKKLPKLDWKQKNKIEELNDDQDNSDTSEAFDGNNIEAEGIEETENANVMLDLEQAE